MHCVHLIISGRVQGVFFRRFVYETAIALKQITGFVRNLYSGEVEVLAFSEDRLKLQKFVEYCFKGPATSHVTNIEQDWENCFGEEKLYRIFLIEATK